VELREEKTPSVVRGLGGNREQLPSLNWVLQTNPWRGQRERVSLLPQNFQPRGEVGKPTRVRGAPHRVKRVKKNWRVDSNICKGRRKDKGVKQNERHTLKKKKGERKLNRWHTVRTSKTHHSKQPQVTGHGYINYKESQFCTVGEGGEMWNEKKKQ